MCVMQALELPRVGRWWGTNHQPLALCRWCSGGPVFCTAGLSCLRGCRMLILSVCLLLLAERTPLSGCPCTLFSMCDGCGCQKLQQRGGAAFAM